MTMEEHNDAMPKTKKAKQAKIAKVMREFKAGTLKGSDKKSHYQPQAGDCHCPF